MRRPVYNRMYFRVGHPRNDWLLSTNVELFLDMYLQVDSHMHDDVDPLKTFKKNR